jgi:hypothetical protein
MKLFYKKNDILRGAIIYSSGDTIATLLLDGFSIYRMLGIAFVGATYYAFEIPNYFAWIDKKISHGKRFSDTLKRAGLAIMYFNPLWIARHLLFIKFFSGNISQIEFNIVAIGFYSFLANIPISFTANYLIQNKVPVKKRFFASATFSAIMAIYYAASEVLFK